MSSQSDTEADSFTTFLDWSAPRLDLRFSQPPYDSTLLSLQTASCLLPLLVVNGESARASTTAAATESGAKPLVLHQLALQPQSSFILQNS
jgi:hypothetical protein